MCTLDALGTRGLRAAAGLLRTLEIVACRSLSTVCNGFRPACATDDPKNLVEFTNVTSCDVSWPNFGFGSFLLAVL
jgi:hypothetical protein